VIVYQNEHNFGTVKSANGAIKKSTGHYLKLIAADDALYDCNSLSKAADALDSSPCGIVTGDVMNCDKDLHPIGKYRKSLPEKLNNLEPKEVFKRLCVHNDVVAGGFFFTRPFFKKYGLYDESYKLMEDWPTWLHITKSGCRIFYSSTNPIYMADKKRVLDTIIIPARREIGPVCYVEARLSYFFVNSGFVRKAYGKIFRTN
jgi:glycosyltransferase involved in cell wall biosynthesis